MCSHAGDDQRATTLAEKSDDGVDGLRAGCRWLGSRERRWCRLAPNFPVHHLFVGGQEESRQGTSILGGHGMAQRLTRARRARGGGRPPTRPPPPALRAG